MFPWKVRHEPFLCPCIETCMAWIGTTLGRRNISNFAKSPPKATVLQPELLLASARANHPQAITWFTCGDKPPVSRALDIRIYWHCSFPKVSLSTTSLPAHKQLRTKSPWREAASSWRCWIRPAGQHVSARSSLGKWSSSQELAATQKLQC